MSRAHVLALPYPAQGHVKPLMELSCELVKHGIKVTFVNSEFNHKQILKAQEARGEKDQEQQVGSDQIKLVSIPVELGEDEDRNCLEKLSESMGEVMPKKLEKLIQEINEEVSEESEKINCVVTEVGMGWALQVAEKMGIQRAALFWPASASVLALFLSIPKLLHDGTIDNDGEFCRTFRRKNGLESNNMSRAHVLALTAPAQGHVNPLMDLSYELVKHGLKITFVNEDSTHKQIMKAQEAKGEEDKERVGNDRIQLVSIPDGLEQDENTNSRPERVMSVSEVMPKEMEKLIQDINEESDNEKISCVIADGSMG